MAQGTNVEGETLIGGEQVLTDTEKKKKKEAEQALLQSTSIAPAQETEEEETAIASESPEEGMVKVESVDKAEDTEEPQALPTLNTEKALDIYQSLSNDPTIEMESTFDEWVDKYATSKEGVDIIFEDLYFGVEFSSDKEKEQLYNGLVESLYAPQKTEEEQAVSEEQSQAQEERKKENAFKKPTEDQLWFHNLSDEEKKVYAEARYEKGSEKDLNVKLDLAKESLKRLQQQNEDEGNATEEEDPTDQIQGDIQQRGVSPDLEQAAYLAEQEIGTRDYTTEEKMQIVEGEISDLEAMVKLQEDMRLGADEAISKSIERNVPLKVSSSLNKDKMVDRYALTINEDVSRLYKSEKDIDKQIDNIKANKSAYSEEKFNEEIQRLEGEKEDLLAEYMKPIDGMIQDLEEEKLDLDKDDEMYNEKMSALDRQIEEKRSLKDLLIGEDKQKITSNVTGQITGNRAIISEQIYSKINKQYPNATNKEKFDLFFEAWETMTFKQLKKKGWVDQEEGGQEIMNPGYISSLAASAREMLGWETFLWMDTKGTMSLTEEEEALLDNMKFLNSTLPVYLVNRTRVDDEGFWSGMWEGIGKTAGAKTSQAFGGGTQERAGALLEFVNEFKIEGVEAEQVEALEDIVERGGLGTAHDIGQTGGMLTTILTEFAVGSMATRGLGQIGIVKRVANALNKVNNGIKATKYGKFLRAEKGIGKFAGKTVDAIQESAKSMIGYEVTGQIFESQKDEFNYASGFMGELGGKIAAGTVIGKPIAFVNYGFNRLFKNKELALSVAKKTLDAVNKIASRGVGETGEEIVQTIMSEWNDTRDGKDFWKTVDETLPKLLDDERFLIETFVIGAGFGAMGHFQEKLAEAKANGVDVSRVEQFVDEYSKDEAEAILKAFESEETGGAKDLLAGKEKVDSKDVEVGDAFTIEDKSGKVTEYEIESKTDLGYNLIIDGEPRFLSNKEVDAISNLKSFELYKTKEETDTEEEISEDKVIETIDELSDKDELTEGEEIELNELNAVLEKMQQEEVVEETEVDVEPKIIRSGLSGGFKAKDYESFDVRSDRNVMEKIKSGVSFATTMIRKGKEYVVVGVNLGGKSKAKDAGGRENYSFAVTELNESTPSDIVETLEREAKQGYKEVTGNRNAIIEDIKALTDVDVKIKKQPKHEAKKKSPAEVEEAKEAREDQADEVREVLSVPKLESKGKELDKQLEELEGQDAPNMFEVYKLSKEKKLVEKTIARKNQEAESKTAKEQQEAIRAAKRGDVVEEAVEDESTVISEAEGEKVIWNDKNYVVAQEDGKWVLEDEKGNIVELRGDANSTFAELEITEFKEKVEVEKVVSERSKAKKRVLTEATEESINVDGNKYNYELDEKGNVIRLVPEKKGLDPITNEHNLVQAEIERNRSQYTSIEDSEIEDATYEQEIKENPELQRVESVLGDGLSETVDTAIDKLFKGEKLSDKEALSLSLYLDQAWMAARKAQTQISTPEMGEALDILNTANNLLYEGYEKSIVKENGNGDQQKGKEGKQDKKAKQVKPAAKKKAPKKRKLTKKQKEVKEKKETIKSRVKSITFEVNDIKDLKEVGEISKESAESQTKILENEKERLEREASGLTERAGVDPVIIKEAKVAVSEAKEKHRKESKKAKDEKKKSDDKIDKSGISESVEEKILEIDAKADKNSPFFERKKSVIKDVIKGINSLAKGENPKNLIPGSRVPFITFKKDKDGNVRWDSKGGVWAMLFDVDRTIGGESVVTTKNGVTQIKNALVPELRKAVDNYLKLNEYQAKLDAKQDAIDSELEATNEVADALKELDKSLSAAARKSLGSANMGKMLDPDFWFGKEMKKVYSSVYKLAGAISTSAQMGIAKAMEKALQTVANIASKLVGGIKRGIKLWDKHVSSPTAKKKQEVFGEFDWEVANAESIQDYKEIISSIKENRATITDKINALKREASLREAIAEGSKKLDPMTSQQQETMAKGLRRTAKDLQRLILKAQSKKYKVTGERMALDISEKAALAVKADEVLTEEMDETSARNVDIVSNRQEIEWNNEERANVKGKARELIYGRFGKIEADSMSDRVMVKEMNNDLTKEERIALTFMLENTGLPSKEKSKHLSDKQRAIIKDIMASPRKVLLEYKNVLEERRAEMLEALREAGHLTEEAFVENYVPHLWKTKEGKKLSAAHVKSLKTRNPHTKQRYIKSYEEGMNDGWSPVSLDYATLFQVYSENFHTSIANKNFVEALGNIETSEGKALIKLDITLQGETEVIDGESKEAKGEYIQIKNPAFNKTIVRGGEPITVPIMVHESIYKEVNSIADKGLGSKSGWLPKALFNVYKVSQIVKSSRFIFGLFHAYVLTESAIMMPGGAKMVAKLGAEGAKKAAVKVFGEKLMSNFINTKGEFSIWDNSAEAADLIRDGLTLSRNNDVDIELMNNTLNQAANVVDKALRNTPLEWTWKDSKTGKMSTVPLNPVRGMQKTLHFYEKFMWDYWFNGLKVGAARIHLASELKGKDNLSAEEVTKIRRSVAKAVNDQFGGQRWELLGIDQTTKQMMSLALLSPDWNISTTRQFLQMFAGYSKSDFMKKLRPDADKGLASKMWNIAASADIAKGKDVNSGAYRKAGLKFWAGVGIKFFVMGNLMNYIMTSLYEKEEHKDKEGEKGVLQEALTKLGVSEKYLGGKFMYQNDPGNRFGIFSGYGDVTKRKKYYTFGKQFTELYYWSTDFSNRLAAKLAFAPSATISHLFPEAGMFNTGRSKTDAMIDNLAPFILHSIEKNHDYGLVDKMVSSFSHVKMGYTPFAAEKELEKLVDQVDVEGISLPVWDREWIDAHLIGEQVQNVYGGDYLFQIKLQEAFEEKIRKEQQNLLREEGIKSKSVYGEDREMLLYSDKIQAIDNGKYTQEIQDKLLKIQEDYYDYYFKVRETIEGYSNDPSQLNKWKMRYGLKSAKKEEEK